MNPQLQKLITLLTYSDDGAFAIALYDRVAIRQEMLKTLKEQLKQRVYELTLTGSQRNPIDLIRNLKPQTGEVVCLYDIERAFPDALGYLDLQREVLADLNISLVVWVNHYEYRELATKAPNFYAFRTSTFDFTNPAEIPVTEPLFVGREPDLEILRSLLEKGGCVTLTGYGGVGKSTLALQLSRRMRSRFQETVWVNCETRPLLGDILLQVAVVLMGEGMRQVGPDEQRKRLAKALCERPCLIILDNFESVGEDHDLLHWLKTVSAPSAVLLTSRQQVPELDTPNYSLPELPPNEAIEMFTLRARQAGWQGEEAEIVPRLCELIGNLPLAIELLAARADELPLSQLLEEVGKSLNALVSGDDPLRAERHQSIAACFRVSFDRLSDTARELLKRLSILPDGASEQIIANFTQIQDLQKSIEECIAHSMLEANGKKYKFHPLIRRFAMTQLGTELVKWQQKLVAIMHRIAIDNDDPNDPEKLAVFDVEWRNICAAAFVATELKDWEAVVELSEHLSDFLILRGLVLEAERLMKQAIPAAKKAVDPYCEAVVLNNLGQVCIRLHKFNEAKIYFAEDLSISHRLGNLLGEAQSHHDLGSALLGLELLKDAEQQVHKSAEIAEKYGEKRLIALNHCLLGRIYHKSKQLAAAEKEHIKGFELLLECGNFFEAGKALNNLANIYLSQKRWKQAEKYYLESLQLARRFNYRLDEASALSNLALVESGRGNRSKAIELAEAALAVFQSTEDEENIREAYKFVCDLQQKKGTVKAIF